MNEIHMTVYGNVVSEPVQRATRTGGVFVTFSVASTPRRRTPDGRFVDRETTFVDVICFDALAANAAISLHKGQPVTVEGDFSTRRWVDADGGKRETPQVEASHIGHDLRRGRAAFERVSKAAALGQDRSSEPEVLEAIAAMHGSADSRPSWVDANGEVDEDYTEDPDRGLERELQRRLRRGLQRGGAGERRRPVRAGRPRDRPLPGGRRARRLTVARAAGPAGWAGPAGPPSPIRCGALWPIASGHGRVHLHHDPRTQGAQREGHPR